MAIQKSDSRMHNVSTNIDANSNQINELGDPTIGTDAANKNYVDTEVAGVSGTNLAYDAPTKVVSSDTGTDATLTVVDGSNDGLMSSADFSKLSGIEAGATVLGTTDLSYNSSTRLLSSSTGTDVTLPEVGPSNSGLMTTAQKSKLDNVENLADKTDTANVSTTGAGARLHGFATMSGGVPSLAANSLNIDSITDVGVGKIRFNFSGLGLTANAYTVAFSVADSGGAVRLVTVVTQSATAIELWVRDGNGNLTDSYGGISVMAFSNH